jgi:serine/threonine-protein phosphatase 5
MSAEQKLKDSLETLIGGGNSPGASSSGGSSITAVEDDITPFPSPVLSAKKLAGLSRE